MMEDLDLFSQPSQGDDGAERKRKSTESLTRALVDKMPPFARDSETSRRAAQFIRSEAPTMRVAVLALIQTMGEHGATDEEIEMALDYKHQTASARRNELMNMGLIKKNGKRPTTSGCSADVWVVS